MLEAITTANCQESFSLEGLEHLGDSFLKFAVSERLFLIHDQIDEGHLTKRRKAIICNPMLQKLGTEHGLTVNLLFTVPSLLKFWSRGKSSIAS
jgi:endoribonuclease Dicer